MAAAHLVAEFHDVDAVKAAVVALEGRGMVDAGDVQVEGLPDPRSETNRRAADGRLSRWARHRAGRGGLLGLLIGAAAGALASVLVGMEPQPAAALGAAAGGAFFVGALFAFWALGSRLPVTDGVAAPPDRSSGRPLRLLIDCDPDQADEISPLLEQNGAHSVQRAS